MEAITLGHLLEAVNGTLLGGLLNLETPILRVETDSRTIHPGSLFIPLVGERFDGHAYIGSALEGGAVGCLTARERESYREDKFYVKVASTQRALRDLAAWYKARFDIPFVAVTGSVGKTTAKDMIAAVLGTKYRVLKTEGNFNNNVGLPLTLLRLDRSCEICVLEMGMDRFEEIDYLADIVRPDVGIITNIGDAHIERLGSRENIFKAKCELLPHIKPDGLVILNGDDALLSTLRQMGSPLQGHPHMEKLAGLDCSSGSLGQGLSVANGLALAAKRLGKDYRTYCLMGDGEVQEGQVWEAAMTAAHFGLDNVCAIVDDNGVQLDGLTKDIMNVEPLDEKFRAFGWHVISVDGHDLAALQAAFAEANATKGRPTALIAHTVKGKGISFMEGQAGWHGKAPNAQELAAALAELDRGGN